MNGYEGRHSLLQWKQQDIFFSFGFVCSDRKMVCIYELTCQLQVLKGSPQFSWRFPFSNKVLNVKGSIMSYLGFPHVFSLSKQNDMPPAKSMKSIALAMIHRNLLKNAQVKQTSQTGFETTTLWTQSKWLDHQAMEMPHHALLTSENFNGVFHVRDTATSYLILHCQVVLHQCFSTCGPWTTSNPHKNIWYIII